MPHIKQLPLKEIPKDEHMTLSQRKTPSSSHSQKILTKYSYSEATMSSEDGLNPADNTEDRRESLTYDVNDDAAAAILSDTQYEDQPANEDAPTSFPSIRSTAFAAALEAAIAEGRSKASAAPPAPAPPALPQLLVVDPAAAVPAWSSFSRQGFVEFEDSYNHYAARAGHAARPAGECLTTHIRVIIAAKRKITVAEVTTLSMHEIRTTTLELIGCKSMADALDNLKKVQFMAAQHQPDFQWTIAICNFYGIYGTQAKLAKDHVPVRTITNIFTNKLPERMKEVIRPLRFETLEETFDEAMRIATTWDTALANTIPSRSAPVRGDTTNMNATPRRDRNRRSTHRHRPYAQRPLPLPTPLAPYRDVRANRFIENTNTGRVFVAAAPTGRCDKCLQPGHNEASCPNEAPTNATAVYAAFPSRFGAASRGGVQQPQGSPVTFRGGGGRGRGNARGSRFRGRGRGSARALMVRSDTKQHRRILISLAPLGGVPSIATKGIIDTGATSSLISDRLFARMKTAQFAWAPSTRTFATANSEANVAAIASVTVTAFVSIIGDKPIQADETFYVIPDLPEDVILSCNFSEDNGLISFNPMLSDDNDIDYAEDEPDFNTYPVDTPEHALPEIDPTFPLADEAAALTARFADVFNDTPPREPANVSPVVIKVKPDAKLSFVPPYPQTPPQREATEKAVRGLLEANIIRPVQHPEFAAKMVVVRKRAKPGEEPALRATVNFADLNKVAVPVHAPVPHIRSLLQTLALCVFFAAFDITSAFHCIPIAPESQLLTTFITYSLGAFCYQRLPMGFSYSPAIFIATLQPIIEDILGQHDTAVGRYVIATYIDDILIGATTSAALMMGMEALFTRLQVHRLPLHGAKSHIGRKQVHFLGFQVSAAGISITRERISALLNMHAPTTRKQLRSYLGAFTYVSNFIPNFSNTVAPLHKLLHLGTRWNWTSQHTEAISALKRLLQDNDCLAYIDYDKPIIVRCDASGDGIGGVLTQVQEGEERAIAFCSRSFNDRERGWDSYSKETYALLFCFRKFAAFIAHMFVIVFTDCAALLHPTKLPQSNKITRWWMELQSQPHIIAHVRGIDNGCADALSRLLLIRTNSRSADLELAHGPVTGHYSVKTTLARLHAAGHTWATEEIVKDFIDKCVFCQKEGLRVATLQGPAKNIAALEPFAELAVDHVGPFPTDEEGYSYIFIAVDAFTRFLIAIPQKNLTAVATANALLQVVCTFGLPQVVRSDHGSAFTAAAFQQLAFMLGVHHHLATVGRHEANGIAERAILHVSRQLRLLCQQRQMSSKWSQLLCIVVRNYNATPHSATGFSPLQLLHPGLTPNREIFRPAKEVNFQSPSEYIETLQLVRATGIADAQATQERALKTRVRSLGGEDSLDIGEWVLVKYEERPPNKLAPRLRGPYKVIAKRDENMYTLEDPVVEGHTFEKHISELHPMQHQELTDDSAAAIAARDAVTEDDMYIVEAILDHKYKARRLHLLTLWHGYTRAEATYEPLTNFPANNEVVAEYLIANGLDVQRGSVGRGKKLKRSYQRR